MAPRTISLLSIRPAPSQRAHFAIFVPSPSHPETGSLINVVGAPMLGFMHEFERNYTPSKDIIYPFETTNRRCQEWTIDYVRALVAKGYIGEDAIETARSKRDPPGHGVGLRPVTTRYT
ncbi:hypothetical protein BJX70DRAFT_391966 [Aspergillus crustosus]